MNNMYYLHLEAPNYFFDKEIISKDLIKKKEIDKICKKTKENLLEIDHSESVKEWFNNMTRVYEHNWSVIEKEYSNLNKKYNLGLKDFNNICPKSIKNNLETLLGVLKEGDIICTNLYRGTGSYYVFENESKLLYNEGTIGEYGYILPEVAKRKFKDYIINYKVIDYLALTENGDILNIQPSSTIILSLGVRNFLLEENVPEDVLDNWEFYGE